MDEKVVTQIVLQVLAVLREQQAAPSRNVLVLFSGATAGQRAGLEAITALSQGGHKVTALLSASAVKLLGEDRVRAAGASQVILPGGWTNAPALVKETDLVLIPTLSMHLAAQLAMGTFDSLLSTLALGGLLAGKPVVAVRDGADPDGCGGKVWGAGGAAAVLRACLSANLKTLATYGVVLVEADALVSEAQQRLGSARSKPVAAPTQSRVTASVITQAEIAHLGEGSLLRIPAGSRLTPLAQETATRLRLEVVAE